MDWKSFQIKKNASDIGISGLPVGQLLASTGNMILFDYDQSFNENRHDQSIFSLLIKTMGGSFIDDETYTIPFLYESINLPIWATRDTSNKKLI